MRDYKIVASEPYCCVTAILESILLKHGYVFNQVMIADYFGLTVPADEYAQLSKTFKNLEVSDDIREYGLHLDANGFNTFFSENNIALRETFIKASELSELNFESVLDAIPCDSDVIFFFDYGYLYKETRNIGVGHDGVYLSKSKDELYYLDPGPRRLGVNSVKIEDMLFAIKAAYAGGGISVITKK